MTGKAFFPDICEKIEKYTGPTIRETLECNFTTTKIAEKTVSQIVLMDALKSYFDIILMCGCGIPAIELTGTPEDWEKVKEKARALTDYDLNWWIDELLPVLDHFVLASKGQADLSFWTSICNLYAGSGYRSPITGWLQTLFPYITNSKGKALIRNSSISAYRTSIENNSQDELAQGMPGKTSSNLHKIVGHGVSLENIPGGISSVPFTYLDGRTGKKYDMLFSGGLVACTQDHSDGTLVPRVGWAIIDKTK